MSTDGMTIPSPGSSLVMVGTIPVWLPRQMSNQRFPESEEQGEQLSPGICNKIVVEDISTKLPGRSIQIPSSVSALVMVGTNPVWLPREMTNERLAKPEKQVQELLPGVPDEVTLDHISTKLPWTALYCLWSVSTAWRQAIRSHRVYAARVRSVEKLVVHTHCASYRGDEVVCLYSFRDKCCYKLPGIPGVDRGIPGFCQWIALDSKIYVLGGFLKNNIQQKAADDIYDMGIAEVYREVYVMDVAVDRQWTRCVLMQEGRYNFVSGILDGKIYAFGGLDYWKRAKGYNVNAFEVYDSKNNVWCTMLSMETSREGHRVPHREEELLVQGEYFHASYDDISLRGYGLPVPYLILPLQ